MYRRIAIVVLFLCGLAALDRGIGLILRKGFDQVRTGEAGGQINEALQHLDADAVIFGSSLARYQVDPRSFQTRLGWSAFNAGCDGQDIYYARMLESLLLRRGYQGRLFVYVVNWSDLFHNDLPRSRMFAVFADEDPVISEILGRSSWLERAKLCSHAYRFNTLAVSIARHLLAPADGDISGFVPIEAEYVTNPRDAAEMLGGASRTAASHDRSLFAEKLEHYAEFIRAACERRVQVLLVVGPTYREGLKPNAGEVSALRQLQQVAERQGASFVWLDETHYPEFNDCRLFADQRHLNDRGARLFSRLLVERISRLE